MNHDILKRRLAHKVDTRHHHARDPEEDDILGGYEIARRIELVEIGSLLRPAESRERPKPRAEPGVENVGILLKVGERQSGIARLDLRLLERLLSGLGDKHQLLFPIPNSPFPAKRICRNSMPPPKLTRNAPILNVLHPVEINLAPALGNELNLARLDGFDGGLGERFHLNEPLLRKTRLDDIVTAVAVADLVVVIFDMIEITLGLEIGDESLAAFKAIHTDVLRARELVHVAVVGHNIDLFETMALTYEEVVRIVSGRNLNDTGTELLLNIIVGENGNLAARKRKNHVLADNRSETLVLRIDRDRRIAGERFGTRRRDADIVLVKLTLRAEGAARDGIADIPEVTVIRLVLDLVVRESRTAAGTPVYDVVAFIDEALIVKLSKDLRDGLRATLVERKALARPVGRIAEHTLLMDDRSAVLLLPFPDALDECLAPEILTALTLLAERLLDDVLSRDAGMVGTGEPKRILTLHTAPPDENILNRLIERMAHVKNARHVRRRNYYGIALAVARLLMKITVLLPKRIPLCFG